MMAEPGLWYLHEPFNPNKSIWDQAFSYADPDTTNDRVNQYIAALLSGKHSETSSNPDTSDPLMPLRLLKPPIQRVLIKDPLACLLTGYIARHFNFDTLLLFRHPAGFASSVTRLGWPVGQFLEQFLHDELLMSDHLVAHTALLESYRDRDDMEAAAVLHGALNSVLWRQSQGNPDIRVMLFEDLCADPIVKFATIFEEFGIPYDKNTRARHLALCRNNDASDASYRAHQVNRDSARAASAWRKHLDSQQLAAVRRIWDQFEIPLYALEQDWCAQSTG
ncbi:hypothetical protein ACFL33_01150 [Pseudomonadota bacterium]